MKPNAKDMTETELRAERERLHGEWDRLQIVLEETGGHSGSPGEWIVERLDEINTEINMRDERG